MMKEGNEMEKVRKTERQKEKEFMADLEQFGKAKQNHQAVEVSILQTKILINHGVWVN